MHTQPLPDIPATAANLLGETDADGVTLLTLYHKGQSWRLGSINMSWRQELAGTAPDPAPEELAALAKRGVWLHQADQPPPLALICCGQGSVYPGMGRELYDSFPVAREAMDRLAAKADWDLLALMDETDMEKIVLTRWQQPYLLLLEYAQFHYLQSLGLRPSVFAGHSLGELIALCFAGAYTPEDAWHIIDEHAQVLDTLENNTQRDTGMMAVHAPQSVIDACLVEFPSLLVSNYNTPTQFILSGPKTALQTASRTLRKRRIPAIQLNVTLAFHHPGMRVIREFDLNGLRAVPMQGTRAPMLSNVTAGLYPDDPEGIREYIVDLNENAVRWVACVDVMWQQYKARHFLELGPADTLCGLVGDMRPEALCFAVGRKGKEAEHLRALVARLYALGHLPGACVRARSSGFSMHAPQAAHTLVRPHPAPPADAAPLAPKTVPAHVEAIMPILMEATGCMRQELHPDMDLRHDLSLRSSRFPFIMHEVEKRFGHTLRFDDLLGVVTVRDLANRIHHLIQGGDRQETPATPKSADDPPLSAHHFSHFRDFRLRDARPWPDSPHPCLLPSMQFATLITDAVTLFPQLTPTGAETLSFSMAECPSGVTREGHVDRRDLSQQAERNQCQAELRLRDLWPNGRAKRSYSTVCSARIFLMPEAPKTLTPVFPDPAPVAPSVMPAGSDALRDFYERHTGFGPSFRLLTALGTLEEKRLFACMRVPSEKELAELETSRYIYLGYAIEAAAQAALLLALQRFSGQNGNQRLALSRVAAVHFSWDCVSGETLGLELRNDAAASPTLQFDAEFRNAHGRLVLTLSGMRLDTA